MICTIQLDIIAVLYIGIAVIHVRLCKLFASSVSVYANLFVSN